MRILIIWRNIPYPFHPSLARPFYFVKYNKNHEVTLVAFNDKPRSKDPHLEYYDHVELISIPKIENMFLKGLYSLKNRFSYQNLFFSRDFNVFGKIYSSAMRKRILDLLKSYNFDIVFADYAMSSHLHNINIKIPVILEFRRPELYAARQLYLYEKTLLKRMEYLLQYHSIRLFEAPRYKKFDAGIYVTATHREYAKPFLPKKSFIIPPGVDLEYFKPTSSPPSSPTLVFTGGMNYPINIHAVLYFCNKIYPLIKKAIPNVKFYVVGRHPSIEIRNLPLKDNSIVVTGEVDDVREYVNKAQVVVAPITIDDGGIKNKVLESMAMGKPVVTTSLGARDIGVVHEKNIMIADEPKKFAEYVINLLQDEVLRNKIGKKARKFVEENYSWEKQTRMLEKAFEEVYEDR